MQKSEQKKSIKGKGIGNEKGEAMNKRKRRKRRGNKACKRVK